MYVELILAAWLIWGIYGLYRFNHGFHTWLSPAVRPSAKGGATVSRHHGPACTHPEVEQVEIGDGILARREVVAKICTSCFDRLPADYSSPGSVIITNEKSVPFPYHTIDLTYWTEAQERLATGKEVNQCHE